MSNLTDFIGGSIIMDNRTLSEASVYSPQITDDVNNLDAPSTSSYYFPIEYEFLSGDLSHQYDGVTNGVAFANRYLSSDKIKIQDVDTLTIASDFYGIQTSELSIVGSLIVGVNGAVAVTAGRGFAGGGTGTYGYSGTNKMLGLWDFMPRGGNGGRSYYNAPFSYGGAGFSGGGAYNNGGAGGAFVLIIADSVLGGGLIRATGSAHTVGAGGSGGGGGGMVLILTKAWSGDISISVGGGGGGLSPAAAGQTGSYVILKIETDNTLTLMVHSQNGVSADLNGQTPVYGADASIAW